MITDAHHAIEVQKRRLAAGKKGRAKAVRRWAARERGRAIDMDFDMPNGMRDGLRADFTGCKPFGEV